MQACTIGLSINKDLKLKERKGKRKTGSVRDAYKYQQRAAKALVISEPIVVWQNLAEYYMTPGPPSSTAIFHRFPPVP